MKYVLLIFDICLLCFNGFGDEIMHCYEPIFDGVGCVAVLVLYVGLQDVADHCEEMFTELCRVYAQKIDDLPQIQHHFLPLQLPFHILLENNTILLNLFVFAPLLCAFPNPLQIFLDFLPFLLQLLLNLPNNIFPYFPIHTLNNPPSNLRHLPHHLHL